jgi:hypothetical protein
LAPRGVSAQRIECRTLFAAFGSADTLVLVDLDNVVADARGDLAKFALLVGGGLVKGRDAKIENGALHR